MGHGVGAEIGHRTSGKLHHIVLGAQSGRHSLAGNIGHSQEYLAHTAFGVGQTVGHILLLPFEGSHLLLGLLGLILLALFHQRAYRGGKLVKLCRTGVVGELKLTALRVKLHYCVDRAAAVESFDSQTLHDLVGIFLYLLKSKHFLKFLCLFTTILLTSR